MESAPTILYKTNKRVIQKVGVVSAGKVMAVLYLVFGFLIGGLYGLMFLMLSVFGSTLAATDPAFSDFASLGVGGGVAASLALVICLPVFYGIIGFIGGVIMAAVYNVAARFVGGLELEVE